MKQLQDSSLSSVDEKSFDENSSQELSLQSLSEISGGLRHDAGELQGLRHNVARGYTYGTHYYYWKILPYTTDIATGEEIIGTGGRRGLAR